MSKNYLIILKLVDKFNSILVIFLCVSFQIFSQQKPVLILEVDTTTIKVGEQINYKIQINSDTIVDIQWGESPFTRPFEIIEEFETDTIKGETIKFEKNFSITSFEPGTFLLKSPKISIDNMLNYSDSILIEVLNVRVDTVSKKFFDIKNIIEVKRNNDGWWKIYLALIVILIFLFLGYKLYQKILNSNEEEEKLPIPIEKAIIALKLLESKDLKEQLDYKDYYSKLTDIVKNYLEEDISLDALESTTDELINKLELLKDSGKLTLNQETIEKFKSVLKTADLVKFAKSNPGIEMASQDKKILEKVLLDTKEAIPEPTEEELLKSKEYLEMIKKEKRKKIIKKVIIGVLFSITITFILSVSLFGWKNVSDTLIGTPTKTILNNTWIESSYGAHPIIISTPHVLKRIKSEEINQVFQWGSIEDVVFISVKSITDNEKLEQKDIQLIIDELILELKDKGAKNILTKQQDIFIDQGQPAFKIFGSFDYLDQDGAQTKKEYVGLKFQENNGKQKVLIIFNREDIYAKQIAEKIEKSIIFKIE